MRPRPRLQESRNEAEGRAAQRASDQRDGRRYHPGRAGETGPDHGGGERADEELARDAYVEETGLEPEADRKPTQNERRGGDEGVGDAGTAPEGPRKQASVGA